MHINDAAKLQCILHLHPLSIALVYLIILKFFRVYFSWGNTLQDLNLVVRGYFMYLNLVVRGYFTYLNLVVSFIFINFAYNINQLWSLKLFFKRKIYQKLLEWKESAQGSEALLIQGARRVGKSTLAEEFAKSEYKSYIMLDFSREEEEIFQLFDHMSDLDFFFFRLQQIKGIKLEYRRSVIIFDEVQFCPKARQSIKFLVADGRYDYIETGSLISIRKNTQGILIPSEENRIDMFPMDYEEFLWAIGKDAGLDLISNQEKYWFSFDDAFNRALMKELR